MTIIKNALLSLTANWNRVGWLYIVASWGVSAISHDSFWLGLLSTLLLGAGAFCWGADYQERRTCTRTAESKAN